MSNPPLSRFVHRVRNPLLDQAATFRLTHRVHVATTVATTKSSTNRSLFLFLCPPLMIGFVILIFFVLIFVSLIFYIFWFSVIIFVWILKKCEKHDKNGFFRAFSGTQPNTIKYFPKHFLECNQTLENIFLSQKYFPLHSFYTRNSIYNEPNAA